MIWFAADVLQAPASALFRSGEGWAVFRIENGRAVKREVRVGQRNAVAAQILDGLQSGDIVIRYPSNESTDRARVRTK